MKSVPLLPSGDAEQEQTAFKLVTGGACTSVRPGRWRQVLVPVLVFGP
jgi:hypothetical protein